ncbi:MAG: hypothetical protein AAGF26_13570 [Cyanobacteria bacterium P01_G01_bin.49]
MQRLRSGDRPIQLKIPQPVIFQAQEAKAIASQVIGIRFLISMTIP